MSTQQLQTLHKRNNNGVILEWTIFVERNTYWTVSGQKDGKKVTTERTECVGKNTGRSNETTDTEQALLEAEALWTKKKDKGYTEEVGDVDSAVAHKISPTLAKKYEDHFHKLGFPVACQPKYDGLRCVITRDGAFSREWKSFVTLQHLRDALQPFFDAHPNVVAFDGEVYNHELKEDFNEIVSLVKKSKPDQAAIKKAENKIQYHVYDYVDVDSSKTFIERINFLCHHVQDKTSNVIVTETVIVSDQKNLDQHYENFLEQGYEGQMIRDINSPYQHSRTDKLLKRKTFQDDEYKIVGFLEGRGNRAGCIILTCETKDGKPFNCSVNGNVAYQQRLFQNGSKLLGQNATIKFQNLTPLGIPRFLKCIKIRDINGGELSF